MVTVLSGHFSHRSYIMYKSNASAALSMSFYAVCLSTVWHVNWNWKVFVYLRTIEVVKAILHDFMKSNTIASNTFRLQAMSMYEKEIKVGWISPQNIFLSLPDNISIGLTCT